MYGYVKNIRLGVMKKSVLLLFFAGCVATGIFGIGRKIPMNRVNDLGQREGYWRDSLGEGITHELYYKGGKKDGLFKCFIRNELFLFGEYTADNMSGTWYMFGDEGELRCTIDSIEFNKDSIYTGYPCCRIFCKYKCHSIDYYPSGAVKSEGYMVCDEEFEIEIWEIGEWKYYDESGNLIKTKDYGDRRTP